MKAWAWVPFVNILVLVYGLEEEGVLAIFCWKLEREITHWSAEPDIMNAYE